MFKSFKSVSVLLGILLSGISNISAKADTLTYTVSIPAVSSGSTSFTLPAFDPKLGTLTGVTLVETATVNSTISILNFTADAQPFRAYSGSTLSISGGNQTLSASPVASTSGTFSAPNGLLYSLQKFPNNVGTIQTTLTVPPDQIVNFVKANGTISFKASAPYAVNSGGSGYQLGFGTSSLTIGGTLQEVFTFTKK